MNKLIAILFLGFVALLVIPVLLTQFDEPVRRKLESVESKEIVFEEIGFRNSQQDLMLAGMLFVPDGEGPFPAVVVIHGSGTSRRANGWYLTLTRHLQQNGIAVLLPDKRGSERSEGNWRTASFEDLATDTEAAIAYLAQQDSFSISLSVLWA